MHSHYYHSSGSSFAPVQQPRCPRCGEHMSLAKIPGPSASDIRTFECAWCDHIHTATIQADPMHSAAALWLASHDLRSPT
jgi:predicted  nucleic acid-binding Zn ribbon protein